MPCVVPLLEQATVVLITDLANLFFSIPIKEKIEKCLHLHGMANDTHNVLPGLCLLLFHNLACYDLDYMERVQIVTLIHCIDDIMTVSQMNKSWIIH